MPPQYVESQGKDSEPALQDHTHYAGRGVAGVTKPITLAKKGIRQIRLEPSGEKKEILSIGLACSECLSGPQLAKVLKRGFEYEQKVLKDLEDGNYAAPLAIHTSAGIPEATGEFMKALEPHLPWNAREDWCLSLQLEGASAVMAAIDFMMQEQILLTGNNNRKMVAVGGASYHGPPSTSFGSACPLWEREYQLKYPVPLAGQPIDTDKLLGEYTDFLEKHGESIGVLLVEPQWGSSQAAYPWPKDLLKTYIKMAQERGIRVVADEIMCGLGRHGHGTLFVSKAWDLDPDAVTFGKSVAGGAYPLSGAIMKHGRDILHSNGKSVLQSHTFAGSSQRALMTATDVLLELPKWLPSIAHHGSEMKNIFDELQAMSCGLLTGQGQGLMWGGLFTKNGKLSDETYRATVISAFTSKCGEVGVLPYFIPAGGFMVTPVCDVDLATIHEIGEKLKEALQRTMDEVGWLN